jgi:EcsC protein family
MPHVFDEASSGALAKIGQAIGWAYEHALNGIVGTSGAEDFANEYVQSNADTESAIDNLVRWQVIQAGTAGFIAGMGGVVTLPVAVPANLAAVLYIQLRMVAAIAHIRGYNAHSDKVKGLATACLAGSSATDTLKDVGINVGSKFTMQGINKIPGNLILRLNQAVGFRLVTKAGTTGVMNLSRLVPVVGGLISGGIDAATTRAIAAAAKQIFSPMSPDHQTTNT